MLGAEASGLGRSLTGETTVCRPPTVAGVGGHALLLTPRFVPCAEHSDEGARSSPQAGAEVPILPAPPRTADGPGQAWLLFNAALSSGWGFGSRFCDQEYPRLGWAITFQGFPLSCPFAISQDPGAWRGQRPSRSGRVLGEGGAVSRTAHSALLEPIFLLTYEKIGEQRPGPACSPGF